MILFYAASLLLTALEVHFYAGVFGATMITMLIAMFILPKCACFEVKYEKFPEDQAKLKSDMLTIFKKEGYMSENIITMKNRGGDLHANAYV